MKKIIFVFALLITAFTVQAKKPTIEQLEAKISATTVLVNDLQEKQVAQRSTIDSLLKAQKENIETVKTPIKDVEGAKNLLGALIGLLSFLLTNILFRFQKVKDWVEEKWSKGMFSLSLGAGISLVFIAINYFVSNVGIVQSVVWLISAWGVHFAAFTTIIGKAKEVK